MIQKYTHDGSKMLLQIGKKGVVDSSDGTVKGTPLNSPAAIFFMPSSIFIDRQKWRRVCFRRRRARFEQARSGDGCKRNLFASMAAGRHAGGPLFDIANDGMVYVCNRDQGRIQIYDKRGKFLKSMEVAWIPATPFAEGKTRDNGGAAVAIGLSHDANQKWIYLINQQTSQVDIIERESGKMLTSFGRTGHFPGEFDQAHGIAVDSKGNVYVAENRGPPDTEVQDSREVKFSEVR